MNEEGNLGTEAFSMVHTESSLKAELPLPKAPRLAEAAADVGGAPEQ